MQHSFWETSIGFPFLLFFLSFCYTQYYLYLLFVRYGSYVRRPYYTYT